MTISPPVDVTPNAPVNVRHGLAREQLLLVLLSLPAPLTNVRTADAFAAEISANVIDVTQNAPRAEVNLIIFAP